MALVHSSVGGHGSSAGFMTVGAPKTTYTRGSYIVLAHDLEDPAVCVVLWAPILMKTGGRYGEGINECGLGALPDACDL